MFRSWPKIVNDFVTWTEPSEKSRRIGTSWSLRLNASRQEEITEELEVIMLSIEGGK